MATKVEVVEIQYNELKKLVESGYKLANLAEKYGISQNKMRKTLKDCGLSLKRSKGPAVVIKGIPGEPITSSDEDDKIVGVGTKTVQEEELFVPSDETSILKSEPNFEDVESDDIFKEIPIPTKPKPESRREVAQEVGDDADNDSEEEEENDEELFDWSV